MRPGLLIVENGPSIVADLNEGGVSPPVSSIAVSNQRPMFSQSECRHDWTSHYSYYYPWSLYRRAIFIRLPKDMSDSFCLGGFCSNPSKWHRLLQWLAQPREREQGLQATCTGIVEITASHQHITRPGLATAVPKLQCCAQRVCVSDRVMFIGSFEPCASRGEPPLKCSQRGRSGEGHQDRASAASSSSAQSSTLGNSNTPRQRPWSATFRQSCIPQ